MNFSELKDKTSTLKNPSIASLMQKTIESKKGKLGPHGEIIINTGKHTGRSADDKYVVKNEITQNDIWWENNINEMSEETFSKLEQKVLSHLSTKSELYYTERAIGHKAHHELNIEFISSEPYSAHFTYYMFKNKEVENADKYQIIHAPDCVINPKDFNAKSETVIVTCFKRKMTIIVGTFYSGEIKKSMFSIMNFILPKMNILPMHSGASTNQKNESFVFFGLSGTGKTTLSTDEGMRLIGDDEHGLTETGVFNFEGGCYAKTFKLSPKTEPQIYKASTQFSSFLENVTVNQAQSELDFFDGSVTENGRSSYPLAFIEDRIQDRQAQIPKHLFFLSADAFGVLPPVAKLSSAEALEYFVLGYTAKLAGTEIGVKSPKAAFSPCFGAPFMLLHPKKYQELLKFYIEKFNINVWLVNTGWYKGGYGVGERFPLSITRDLIRAIQNNELDNINFKKDEIFGFMVPEKVRNISTDILNPALSWKDKVEYQTEAKKLKARFEQEISKFK